MSDKLWLALLGCSVGVLSGMGVGGGSLLILLLSGFLGVEQTVAQGVNLAYFLPVAAIAVLIHFRKGNIESRTAWRGTLFGAAAALLGAFFATAIDQTLLRKLFAGMLLFAGCFELFQGRGFPTKEE
ncbi:MAG: TSUP family transporter [Clostridia bacterium]|nr:TSUP family transporter [Clostridia bacterium]